jgi:hypothetical protein
MTTKTYIILYITENFFLCHFSLQCATQIPSRRLHSIRNQWTTFHISKLALPWLEVKSTAFLEELRE